MNKSIAVIGIGTAGITSLSHLLAWLPEDWNVVSIYDPNTKSLGIGESTSTQIPYSLYHGCGFNLITESENLDATVKHGVRYVNWRNDDFYTRLPPPSYGMHFNNFKLQEYSFKNFKSLWKDRFSDIQGNIQDLKNHGETASCKIDDKEHHFQYIIDCRGYPEDYSDYEIVETIPVNSCLVHTINEPGDWNHTVHQATKNGWMFGIPLKTRQGWGYLYNNSITKKQDAISDISEIFDTEKLDLKEFNFTNYRATRYINHRIIKNGNRALFYEPLEALSGWFYDLVIRKFFDYAISKKYTEKAMNDELKKAADDYELFICYMYHGGSIYDTDFWKHSKNICKKRLNSSERFKHIKNFLKQIKPYMYSNHSVVMPFSYDVWKKLDVDLGYNFFS